MPDPFFFFNDTATTEIYTLSLHDALPIFVADTLERARADLGALLGVDPDGVALTGGRSEEHTSELQSRRDLVCRLLLEKKKKNKSQNGPRVTNTAASLCRPFPPLHVVRYP